jgi:hypothetical protein
MNTIDAKICKMVDVIWWGEIRDNMSLKRQWEDSIGVVE